MKKLTFLIFLIATATSLRAQQKPNIIFILADDLGYGDVSCFNPQSKISTTNMDRLAKEGMMFINAHASSSVCTPSRYSILTGRYNWRSRLQEYVLDGYDSQLIKENTYTLPQMLKGNGYYTGCIGKWHLGMNWMDSSNHPIASANYFQQIDFNKPITNGPLSKGFDYYFGISASLDMPPFVYIENDKVTQLPTVTKKWKRAGISAKDFEAENVIPDIVDKAERFISNHANGPFFLYLPLTSPHTPIVPSKKFQGTSNVTAYGDFVLETDWAVGRILALLDHLHINENTIVIVSSDNGFAPYVLSEYNVEKLGHFPSYKFRGYKSDDWEGGHHVPLIIRWPRKVKAGTTSDQLVGLIDVMATCADMLNIKTADSSAVDSYSFLPTLLSINKKSKRADIIMHSIDGFFAIRKGDWKLILCPGSGGWSNPTNDSAIKEKMPLVQLYNIAQDIGEKNNVQKQHPEIVAALTALLEKYVKDGRSTIGPKQKNDADIDILKRKKYEGLSAHIGENKL